MMNVKTWVLTLGVLIVVAIGIIAMNFFGDDAPKNKRINMDEKIEHDIRVFDPNNPPADIP